MTQPLGDGARAREGEKPELAGPEAGGPRGGLTTEGEAGESAREIGACSGGKVRRTDTRKVRPTERGVSERQSPRATGTRLRDVSGGRPTAPCWGDAGDNEAWERAATYGRNAGDVFLARRRLAPICEQARHFRGKTDPD